MIHMVTTCDERVEILLTELLPWKALGGALTKNLLLKDKKHRLYIVSALAATKADMKMLPHYYWPIREACETILLPDPLPRILLSQCMRNLSKQSRRRRVSTLLRVCAEPDRLGCHA